MSRVRESLCTLKTVFRVRETPKTQLFSSFDVLELCLEFTQLLFEALRLCGEALLIRSHLVFLRLLFFVQHAHALLAHRLKYWAGGRGGGGGGSGWQEKVRKVKGRACAWAAEPGKNQLGPQSLPRESAARGNS